MVSTFAAILRLFNLDFLLCEHSRLGLPPITGGKSSERKHQAQPGNFALGRGGFWHPIANFGNVLNSLDFANPAFENRMGPVQ